MSTSRRVGLLGGTFDPVHLGHLVVAEEARVELHLDEVRFLPAGAPWMKDTITEGRHRIAMLEAALGDRDGFTIDAREVRRGGPSYTVDTLEELHAEEPGTDWYFLLGEDAAQRLPEWHRIDDALALAKFVVVSRPGYDLDLPTEVAGRTSRLEVPLVGVSSTLLRERFGAGRAVRFQVPDAVETYIRARGLYGASEVAA